MRLPSRDQATPEASVPRRPLSIIADVPTPQPGLGFAEYAAALADAIRGGEPPQFTIGLYGAWGSGKSSLLKAIDAALSRPESDVMPVFFDAWRYERADHIVIPLLHRICDVANSGDPDLAKVLRRALGALILSLKFNIQGLTIDPKAAKGAWEDSGLTPLDDAFSRPFIELQQVPHALKGRRIAVLIDDLDRCSPENVVAVLEAINLVMDVPGFIFVLALDYEVLIQAIATKYPHVSGHAFIEKMVQLPFRVPPLYGGTDDLLTQLVPAWDALARELPEPFVSCCAEIAMLALRGNPRQIKRYINSFLVVDRIVRARGLSINYAGLAAVMALQLAWPDEHRRVQEDVLLGHPSPLLPLQERAAEDPVLSRFADRFFAATPYPLEELRTLMQLSAVVVASDPDDVTPLAGPADEIRERNHLRLVEALLEHGYQASPRSPRLYFRDDSPGIRFAFTKFGFRREARDADGWKLRRSFLLTRGLDDALSAIAATVPPAPHLGARQVGNAVPGDK